MAYKRSKKIARAAARQPIIWTTISPAITAAHPKAPPMTPQKLAPPPQQWATTIVARAAAEAAAAAPADIPQQQWATISPAITAAHPKAPPMTPQKLAPPLQQWATTSVGFAAASGTAKGPAPTHGSEREITPAPEAAPPRRASRASRRHPGHSKDYEMALQVEAIVTPFGPQWSSGETLDGVLEALDENKIPTPKTWPARDEPLHSWTAAGLDGGNRDLARKAILHHLELAKESRKL